MRQMSGSPFRNGVRDSVKKKVCLIVFPSLAVLLLDQITKWAVLRTLDMHQSVTVVSGFFNLVHVRNRVPSEITM